VAVGSAGFCTPDIRIDRFGETFTALSFVNVQFGYKLTSSKGGIATVHEGIVDLTGDAWTNVEWLSLTTTTLDGFPQGFDDLVVQYAVTEPYALLLLATGLLGLIGYDWRCGRR